MRSLYDVFTAIKADEGDHVGTMKACLDPDVAVLSPSLEKKVLTGVALVAAFSYFLTAGDIPDLGGLGDLADSAVDSTAVVEGGGAGSTIDRWRYGRGGGFVKADFSR